MQTDKERGGRERKGEGRRAEGRRRESVRGGGGVERDGWGGGGYTAVVALNAEG